jgi:hypothetical protein
MLDTGCWMPDDRYLKFDIEWRKEGFRRMAHGARFKDEGERY